MSIELKNKTVVLTGSISGLTNHQAKSVLEDQGATVRWNLSGKTDLLISGWRPGPRITSEAKERGILIVKWGQI